MSEHSPAAERNRHEILPILRDVLPSVARVLELGSGSGQHAEAFARAEPGWDWQPTDRRAEALATLRETVARAALPNLREPLALDIESSPWPVAEAEVCLSVNVLHVAPWSTSLAWLAGVAWTLSAGGLAVYYGPLLREDRETAPSNLAFDESLRARDPAWGLRELADLKREGEAVGLDLDRVIDMPRNNSLLVFRRR